MNRYGKQQCLDMDWNNAKEIRAEEIAYCIHTYDIDVDRVPDSKLRLVMKELNKLHKQQEDERTQRMIKAELAIGGDVIGYYLDPELFNTDIEAMIAMNALGYNIGSEETKIENGHNYKDTNTYSRDRKRMKESMNNVRRYWIKLGGDINEFNEVVSQIKLPKQNTLRQDVHMEHGDIVEQFISNGVSPTRANNIAKAITKASMKWLK